VFDFDEQETKKLHFRLIDIASVLIKYTQHSRDTPRAGLGALPICSCFIEIVDDFHCAEDN